jgi:nucleoid DNA-binding protein
VGGPKKQAVAMLTGFVADIGRALKKGSKIRIPNLGAHPRIDKYAS